MTAKEWLNRGRALNKTIEGLEKAKARAYDIAVGTAAELTEKVQESHGNSVEDRLVTYADYCREIDEHKIELLKILKEIMEAIMKVEDPTLRNLLIYRYLDFETWESIAVMMNYGIRHVYKLHGRALNHIDKIINGIEWHA
nr:MAG TPA: Protein of unknown function (DUF1492) [Caudoviricetes sp.]